MAKLPVRITDSTNSANTSGGVAHRSIAHFDEIAVIGSTVAAANVSGGVVPLGANEYAAMMISAIGQQPAAWFRADTGVTVTGTGAAQVNDQANSDHALVLPGVSGNYASTPDSVAASITGDIDIRVRVALSDWTPAGHQALIGKWTAAPNLSYQFYIALATFVPTIAVSTDGTAVKSVGASAAPTVSDGDTLWLRATRASASGDCNFYTSTDTTNDPNSVTWTLLGTANRTTAAGGIADTTSVVELGIQNGTSSPASGKIYRAAAYSTIGGTSPAWDFNAADFTKGSTSATSSTTGEVWTVNQSGNPPAHIGNKYDLLQVTDASRPPYLSYSGTKYMYLPGVAGNLASTPSAAANQLTGDIDIRVKASLTDWTPAAINTLVAKYSGTPNNAYWFYVAIGGALVLTVTADGTTANSATSSAVPTITDGATKWVRATRVASTGKVNFYTSDDGSTWSIVGVEQSSTAGAINAGSSIVGLGQTGGGSFQANGSFYRASIYSTIGGTTPVVDFNPNLDGSDQAASFTSSATGEVWTINKSGGLPAQIVGRPSLLFDGTADYLKCNAFTLNQPETVYIAFKQVSWTNLEYVCDGVGASMQIFQDTASPKLSLFAGSTLVGSTALSVGSYGVLAAVFNGASSSITVNNNSAITGDVGAQNAGGFTLGATRVPSAYSNIQVLECLLFSTAHDATQRARVIQYLAGRHGVAL